MEKISLFVIVMRGGILMIPILICSIIVIWAAVERWLTYRRASVNSARIMMRVRHLLGGGDIQSALQECVMTPGPVAAVVKAGLEKANQGRDRMRESMEAAGNNETYHLEKNLSILATLSGIAPLLGFLGTVTGMIKAFMKIQQLSGNVNADVLAGGIWEAMVTTAAGLAVGIPAMIFYNYYVNRVKEFIFHMENAGEEVLNIIGSAGTEPQPIKRREIVPESQEESVPYEDPFKGGKTRLAGNIFDEDRFNPSGGDIS